MSSSLFRCCFKFLRDFGHSLDLSLCFFVLTSQFYSGLPLVVVMMVKLLRLSFVVYGGRVQGGCHVFALDMMVITFALNTFTMS